MSTIDLLTRVNGIIKKYDKYDADKLKEGAVAIASNDHFLRLFTTVQDDLNDIPKRIADSQGEKNRAVIAAFNAEIRRSKAALRLEIPKLQKLAPKKVKGVKPEDILKRPNMVVALAAKIEETPDGVNMGQSRKRNNNTKDSNVEIKIDNYSPEDVMRSGITGQHSAESKAFNEEYEANKKKQDEGLNVIEKGLDTLKNLAQDIGEELNRQDQLMDEADTKVDKAGEDMKTTNSRLKQSVNAMRSSRNFCVDITLLVVILGIAAYLYKALKK